MNAERDSTHGLPATPSSGGQNTGFPGRDERDLGRRSFRIPEDDWKWLTAEAAKTGTTRGEVLRTALAFYREHIRKCRAES